jgi:hypothetical protein
MRRRILISLLLAALVGSALAEDDAAAENPFDYSAHRATLEKWVEAKQLMSKEREDWRVGQMIMGDRKDLLARETRDLNEKADADNKEIGEIDDKLAEMTATRDGLKEATEGLSESVADVERRVLDLLATSPTPIRDRVQPLSQRIPKTPNETKLSLSERFQNVIGILNELNKYSREITEASEVRDLADGANAEVTVLYLGLAQAYFCNTKGGVAGVGRPGPDGWVWEQQDDLVEPVAETLAVFRNEKPAKYIPLPLEIQ